MDGAAAAFPDINFVIFHVGLPFLDENLLRLHGLNVAETTARLGR